MEIFDERKLRAEIVRVWGEYGAHIEVFDRMLAQLKILEELVPVTALLDVLEKELE